MLRDKTVVWKNRNCKVQRQAVFNKTRANKKGARCWISTGARHQVCSSGDGRPTDNYPEYGEIPSSRAPGINDSDEPWAPWQTTDWITSDIGRLGVMRSCRHKMAGMCRFVETLLHGNFVRDQKTRGERCFHRLNPITINPRVQLTFDKPPTVHSTPHTAVC